jgi:Tol biopolymer transport system component
VSRSDARSDIFSLGAVIYEMVTGQRPFKGDSPASVIGAILKDEPTPIKVLRPMAPAILEGIVATSLAKDRDDRWQNARDLSHALEWVLSFDRVSAKESPKASARGVTIAVVAAVVAGAAALIGLTAGRRSQAPLNIRFLVTPPQGNVFASSEGTVPSTQLAISPDGQRIAFVAARTGGLPSVWVRELTHELPKAVSGSEGASYPFWAPDNRTIGFFADNKLKRVDVEGEAAQALADASNPAGGAWNSDGVIVFSPNNNSPLFKVLASGGPATPLTALDGSREEVSHRWPAFLPDGRRYLYRVRSPVATHEGIYIGSLDGTPPVRLMDSRWYAQYAEGHVFSLVDHTLTAQPFDPRTGELKGEPRAIIHDVQGSSTDNAGFAVSAAGPLVAGGSTIPPSELAWVDRTGKLLKTLAPAGDYIAFALAPDEGTLAYSRVDPQLNTPDLWSLDLRRGTSSRVTSDVGMETHPLWSGDGQLLAFRAYKGGLGELRIRSTASREQVALNSAAGFDIVPTSWSKDQRSIVYLRRGTEAGTRMDLWIVALADGHAQPYLETPFKEMHGRLSPDDRFIAYASDESGQFEIYVSAFADPLRRWPISTGGGIEPSWRGDGRELFYLSLDGKLISVPLTTPGAALDIGEPIALFDTHIGAESRGPYRQHYQPAADGKRFLITRRMPEQAAAPIRVLLDWRSTRP